MVHATQSETLGQPQPNVPVAAGLALLGADRCAHEPVHTIGQIQPHGLLLAVSEPDLIVRQVSANISTLLGLPVETVLGNSLEPVLGTKHFERFRQLVQLDLTDASPIPMQIGSRALEVNCIAHRIQGLLIVELELLQDSNSLIPCEQTSHFNLPSSHLEGASSLADLAQIAATEVRRRSGFQRVMVYRFDEDWNGEVIAESAEPSPTSYLGLRFPASDIPVQARRVFTLNCLRTIVDVDAPPVAIIPEQTPLTAAPLDLTLSLLRSAAPIHLEYLRNMGVQSTLTVSVLLENRLWGIIACHHLRPLQVDYGTRSVCELIGRMLAAQIGLRLENTSLQMRLASSSLLNRCTKSVNECKSLDYADYLNGPVLLQLFDADELVVHINGDLSTLCNTLKPSSLLPLLPQLRALSANGIATSNNLTALDPGIASYARHASGALYIGLSEQTGDYLLLLRRELIETVNWAGNPDKSVNTDEQGRLRPRTSFQAWQEVVRGRSSRWTAPQIENARMLRDQLLRLKEDLALLTVRKDRLLSDSELRFRFLADAMPQIVWTAKPDGRVDYYNQRWYSYVGRQAAECTAMNWTEVIHPEDVGHSIDCYSSSLRTGRTYEVEYRIKRGSDGAYRWHLGRAFPLRDEKDEIILWVGTCTDIEDQKRMLNQLESAVDRRTAELVAAQNQMQTILDSATNVSIIATDNQGIVTVFNSGAENLLGYTSEEIVGKHTPSLIHLASEVAAREAELSRETDRQVRGFDVFVASARKGLPEEREWTYVRKDGGHVTVTLVVTALHGSSGNVTGFLGVAMDISARKRAEDAARASAEHFRQIVEAVEDYALVMLDPAGNVVSWNIGAERIKGYQAHEILGRHFSCFYLPKDIANGIPARNCLAAERGRYSEEGWRVRKDGSEFLAEVFISAVRDDTGKLLGFAKVVHDITERKRTEERFQIVVEAAPSSMIMVGTDGKIALVNAQTEKLFGFERHELLGQSAKMLLPQRLRRKFRGFFAEFFGAPSIRKVSDVYGLRKDGSEVPLEIGLNPIDTLQGQFVLASIVDITERQSHERQMLERNAQLVAANQELNISVRRLGMAIDALPAGLWDWQLPSDELVWDGRMRQIYGVPPDTQPSFALWQSTILPEDLPASRAQLQQIIASKKQGALMFRIRRPDGAIRFIQAAIGTILNDSGEVVRLTGISIDTTDRKFNEDLERQVDQRTAQLKAANKELSEFAYVASHDLKAPLRVIDNASKWLEEDLQEHLTGENRENLSLLRGRVRRMDKLLDDLLEYADIGKSRDSRYAESIRGDVLIGDVMALLPGLRHSIKIDRGFDRIQVCRMPLQSILMNLIGNAIKHHHKHSGNIEVTVEEHPLHFLFSVKDDGPGIAPRFHDQIFKMFQTLKPRDQVEGSGMGLAKVRKNVEAFGGTLHLESELGQGSTFRFTWPKQQRLQGEVE